MTNKHAFLSPSASHRWLVCYGAPAMEALCERRSSSYADEGTRKHKVAADVLLGIGTTDEQDIIEYVDYVDSQTNGLRFVEQELDISTITNEFDAKGTADCVIYGNGVLKIIDLKTGRGVKVDPEENTQLIIYAYAAALELKLLDKVEFVELHIAQPPLNNFSNWSLTFEELKERINDIRTKSKIALSLRGKKDIPVSALSPDPEACRFCNAAAICPALKTNISKAADEYFEPIEEYKAPDDSEIIGKNLHLIPFLKVWILANEKRANEMLREGRKILGWKLVEGRKGRKVFDIDELSMMLAIGMVYENDISKLVRKVLTPNQAEAALKNDKRKWMDLSSIIIQPPGKPEIVKESDIRPALDIKTIEQEFEDLNQESEESELDNI